MTRRHLFAFLALAATLAAATAIRYLLVEPPAIAHACDAGGAAWWCAVRRAAVAAFHVNALGFGSLIAAVASLASGRMWVATLAAALGLAGLMLYNHDLAAVGFAIGTLRLARLGAAPAPPLGHEHRSREREA